LWTGSTGAGYGKFGIKKRNLSAHRLSYRYFVGPIPEGLFVLHSCDTPLCVNPAHLRVGTAQDNVDDMMARGRKGKSGVRGERCHFARLTSNDVREIRRRVASGESYLDVARAFGVTRVTTRDIHLRLTWKHLD
jgi:hypothetical protein